jgi:multidrug efflux system outer membrane protein
MKIRNQLAFVIVLTLVLMLLPRWLGAQTANGLPRVTLTEAREKAIAVAPAGVAARGEVSAAVWARRGATANLFTPQLVAGTSYAAYSDPFFNLGTGGISTSATSATLQASYTLLGHSKLAELKRAGAELESATAGETAATFKVALDIDAAYYAVLAAQELSRVAAARLERAQEQLTLARARVRSGNAIATDSLQLLLELNKARLDVIRRDSALNVAQLNLGAGIGLDGPASAAPIDTVLLPPLPLTQEQALAELRTRGPDLLVARANERHADAVVNVQRAGYLPEVTVAATIGAYDSRLFPDATNRSQLLVNVSLPLWNGGQREVALARARAERDFAKAQREQRERSAGATMAAAYSGFETARAATELAQVGVVAATENFRVQRARYREGSTTILDLLEAQVGLSEAESALVQSRYAARLALAQVEALLGRRLVNP